MDSGAEEQDKCQGCENEMKGYDSSWHYEYVPHRKLPYETRLLQIQTWLGRCLQDHTECCWGEASSQLPTRVLELELRDGTGDIRLVGSGDIDKHGKYAALTYRWGPSPETIFMTTTANLQQNRTRIDVNSSSFNNLFRDAVNFVRSLGLKYLWIDALCIIQQDHADWLAEAAKMATVYSNAYVTISAAVSSSPDDRLISSADLIYPGTFGGPKNMIKEVSFGTLAERGWCLQERCLSRRIIHFGNDQIHWECCGATRSEHVLHHELGEHVLDPPDRILLGPHAFRSAPSPGLQHQLDPYHHWYRIMRDYTMRRLTQENDSLPALLGLVKTFMAATGDRMHLSSGLWLGDLVFGLLWSRQTAARPRVNERQGRVSTAPTWSWLSVAGPVRWPMDGELKVREQVLAITAMNLDETSLSISIRGKLLGPSELTGILRKHIMEPGEVDYSWDDVEQDRRMRRSDESGYNRAEIYVLIVIEPASGHVDGLDGHGLALFRTNEHPASYRRIGYARLPDLDYYTYRPPIHSLPLRTIRLVSGVSSVSTRQETSIRLDRGARGGTTHGDHRATRDITGNSSERSRKELASIQK